MGRPGLNILKILTVPLRFTLENNGGSIAMEPKLYTKSRARGNGNVRVKHSELIRRAFEFLMKRREKGDEPLKH